MKRYITPEEFEQYKRMAYTRGFSMVAPGTLARSSYNGVIANFVRLESMYSKNKNF